MTPLVRDRRRLMNIACNKLFATGASVNDVQDMAHHCAVTGEMLADLRAVATAACDNNWAIEPASLVAWLDDNTPQLTRTTATQEQPA